MKNTDDFELPASSPAREIAETIINFVTARLGEAPDGGGCRAFYDSEEWAQRGERYGRGAPLVVVHDGGALAPIFNIDYECYDANEALTQALGAIGYYPEQINSWSTAIWPQ